jgi:hypothetical protein
LVAFWSLSAINQDGKTDQNEDESEDLPSSNITTAFGLKAGRLRLNVIPLQAVHRLTSGIAGVFLMQVNSKESVPVEVLNTSTILNTALLFA